MSSLEHWHICDELTVIQAALLIVGIVPVSDENTGRSGLPPCELPPKYHATFAALRNAILADKIPAKVRRSARVRGWDDSAGDGEREVETVGYEPCDWIESYSKIKHVQEPWEIIATRGVIYRTEPDWDITTVSVDALRTWLISRGEKAGFFFVDTAAPADFLNKDHSRYSPKLAAAVRAWQAVEGAQGVSIKEALRMWLRAHAAQFKLLADDGKPKKSSIEECATVANWDQIGGAPKTPGS